MHNKISLTDYNLTKPNHMDQSILYQEHVLSTFCYSYPQCQSISMESYSHFNFILAFFIIGFISKDLGL